MTVLHEYQSFNVLSHNFHHDCTNQGFENISLEASKQLLGALIPSSVKLIKTNLVVTQWGPVHELHGAQLPYFSMYPSSLRDNWKARTHFADQFGIKCVIVPSSDST